MRFMDVVKGDGCIGRRMLRSCQERGNREGQNKKEVYGCGERGDG